MSDSMIMHNRNEEPANVAALLMEPCCMNHMEIERIAVEVSNRFLVAAKGLPQDGQLGWQTTVKPGGQLCAAAFSGPDVRVTKEDLNWIFGECARVDEETNAPLEPLGAEGRRLYTLRYAPCTPEVQASDVHRRRLISGHRDIDIYDEEARMHETQSYLRQALETLGESGGILRITAAADNGGQGTVFIELPEEMSLRLRTMLRLAFLDTVAQEVTGTDAEPLPAECLTDCMTSLLHAMMYDHAVQLDKQRREEEDEMLFDSEFLTDPEDEPETETSIEVLDLSVRAYNCLKRGGVHTVEKLRTMTDEDYRSIRNLGRKCVEEIKQKLCAYASRPTPQPRMVPAESLDSLIGLRNVKEQVRQITAFAKMKKDMAALGKEELPMVLNMEFVGNPGTAKTTVARIIAGMFHEMGLLSSDDIIEVGRADLVASYVGQTANKVKSVFERARGKLLFIDEAYALVDYWEGEFGDEAISTIVQEMENHRDENVVIFAGYPDKMETFFARNPGLRSRVPFRICFSDYCAEEMVQIAEREVEKRGFTMTAEAKQKVAAICAATARGPEMGNGRFCRNLVEGAVLRYAARVYGGEGTEGDRDFVLAGEDFAVPAAIGTEKQTMPIGFCV